MLRGDKVSLRAQTEADAAVFHAELLSDVEMRSRADSRAWRPYRLGSSRSPYTDSDSDDKTAVFSVVERATGELAGEALLWAIDAPNRMAHLGMSLLPSARGRGLGADTVRLLCRYGFVVLGLQRLQLETLADNEPMIRAAVRCGFTHEGTLRQAAWVLGAFADEVVYGQLASEFPTSTVETSR
jgi:RimJ/RimL family protein N-acetyltransferase